MSIRTADVPSEPVGVKNRSGRECLPGNVLRHPPIIEVSRAHGRQSLSRRFDAASMLANKRMKCPTSRLGGRNDSVRLFRPLTTD